MIILIIKKVAPRNGTVELVFVYIYKIAIKYKKYI